MVDRIVVALVLARPPPLLFQARVRHCRCSCRGVYHLVAATTAALFHKLRSRHFSTSERPPVGCATGWRRRFLFLSFYFFIQRNREGGRGGNGGGRERERRWTTNGESEDTLVLWHIEKQTKRSVHARTEKTSNQKMTLQRNRKRRGGGADRLPMHRNSSEFFLRQSKCNGTSTCLFSDVRER